MRWGVLGRADGEVQRRWVNPRLHGVLCISEYLQAYYRAKGVRTALLPPLLDLSDAMWTPLASRPEPMRNGKLKIIFSGSPIRERHDLILRAVLEARCHGTDVVLEYLGCTRDAIATMRGVGEDLLQQMGDGVRFFGWVPFEALTGILASASFGLLFREDSKWSKACFPSKVPEFLALGVPLLCNITSDLHQYLKDGVNALIASELSVDCLAATLRRASTLTTEHYQQMRAAARTTAQAFDGRRFGQTYRDLLVQSA
jgi:glycosyltransferase involved in cell wall biosynthesis